MKTHQPFSHNYFIGYVNQVYPDYVRVHFPSSVLLNKFIFSGEEFNAGLVGNYVTIEGENTGFLGKILELSLPEKERLELNEKAFRNREFHPTGKVEILLCFDYFKPDKPSKGISAYPNIGSKVFVCNSAFIQSYLKAFGVKDDCVDNPPTFDFATLTSNSNTSIEVSQQALFGRHCAIVGTTGGGKSWTVSKCLEEVVKNNGKAIIVDATGEYKTFDSKEKVFEPAILSEEAFFHYTNLSVEDVFILLRPSGQVQAPILLEAIKSLKVVDILKNNIDNDFITQLTNGFKIKLSNVQDGEIEISDNAIKKEYKPKKPFNRVYTTFIENIENSEANFDIRSLPQQIQNECIFENDRGATIDITKWGGRQDNHLNNCISLILRVRNLIHNSNFKKIFGFEKAKSDPGDLIDTINNFWESDKNLLRISFEKVGYDFQSREILANAIGKYLLLKARDGSFKERPLILFIDEAHQYLKKHVKDEYFEFTQLSSFDQIAKECRKYGLFLCLATQMPRDIPTGTLSQMGTFIVHRIINPFDKEAVQHSCSTANKNTLDFLPILGEGEAILMGVDFPMPVMLKIKKPETEPDSKTPQFKK
jgi:hypothetical protein